MVGADSAIAPIGGGGDGKSNVSKETGEARRGGGEVCANLTVRENLGAGGGGAATGGG